MEKNSFPHIIFFKYISSFIARPDNYVPFICLHHILQGYIPQHRLKFTFWLLTFHHKTGPTGQGEFPCLFPIFIALKSSSGYSFLLSDKITCQATTIVQVFGGGLWIFFLFRFWTPYVQMSAALRILFCGFLLTKLSAFKKRAMLTWKSSSFLTKYGEPLGTTKSRAIMECWTILVKINNLC